MARRLRILISAYYCSPYRGGEAAVGWRYAVGMAKRHDVTVICGDLSENGPIAQDLERYKREEGLPPGLQIHHIQAEGLTLKIHNAHSLPGLWFLFYEAFRRWQLEALELARRLHEEKPFDLVHHVNVIGFREPGYLWKMGIPFFWGPVSGAPMVPTAFFGDFSSKERFRWGTRNLLNRLQIRRGGRPALAGRAAVKVWAVSREDRAVLASWGVIAEPMLETGCTLLPVVLPKSREAGEPLRVCWSGLFQGIKALPLVLRAIAASDHARWFSLEVLGDGPEASRWRTLASQLGLDGQIRWHGMLPREEALKIMEGSHVMIHSSVKEGTPHVVLEALSMGLPVICHDACGMGTAVDETCGIRVPLVDPGTSIAGFRSALEKLHQDPALLSALSRGALFRARELTWESKMETVSAAYCAALAGAERS
jgi:glycosyltransferase involved in cell wall biosynthesis